MKILIISSFFPPLGGAFCLDQAKALKQAGHDVYIIACNQYGITFGASYFTARTDFWMEENDGIKVFRSNTHGLPKLVKYNAEHWILTVERLFRNYMIEEYGLPDVIHAHCVQWAGVAAARIARIHHIPYFITEHLSAGLFEKEYGKEWSRHKWAQDWLKEAYKGARCVVPVAEELVEGNAHLLGKDYHWQWISNVIDTDFFAYRQRPAYDSSRSYRICCLAVGNIYLKGYDVLAAAWQQLSGCELFIAGRGTQSNEMKRLFPSANNVHILGELSCDEVRELLYRCDLLVLPSRSEVQPLVLLEAMCTGIPVVTTDIITRNLRIENACFVAKTGDADSLVQQIKAALQQGSLSERQSQEVRDMVSPQSIAQQLTELYRRS